MLPLSAALPEDPIPSVHGISFRELTYALRDAACTLFPTTTRRYKTVSVLLTYWNLDSHKVMMEPQLEKLKSIFENLGFSVQRFEIPCRLQVPPPGPLLPDLEPSWQACGDMIMEFVVPPGPGHLKIIYYAGDLTADGRVDASPESGRPHVWHMNWLGMLRGHQDLGTQDILFLLDSPVAGYENRPTDTTDNKNENVVEVIAMQTIKPEHSFTSLLIKAFEGVNIRDLAQKLDKWTTGLLYNTILERYKESVTVVDQHQAPFLYVVSKTSPARAIQIHSVRDNKSASLDRDRSAAQAMTHMIKDIRKLFVGTPKLRLEIWLRDPEHDPFLRASQGWSWIKAFPALEDCMRESGSILPGTIYKGRAIRGSLAVMTVPAALGAYLQPHRAILRQGFQHDERFQVTS